MASNNRKARIREFIKQQRKIYKIPCRLFLNKFPTSSFVNDFLILSSSLDFFFFLTIGQWKIFEENFVYNN